MEIYPYSLQANPYTHLQPVLKGFHEAVIQSDSVIRSETSMQAIP